jgi:hypothetical protein
MCQLLLFLVVVSLWRLSERFLCFWPFVFPFSRLISSQINGRPSNVLFILYFVDGHRFYRRCNIWLRTGWRKCLANSCSSYFADAGMEQVMRRCSTPGRDQIKTHLVVLRDCMQDRLSLKVTRGDQKMSIRDMFISYSPQLHLLVHQRIVKRDHHSRVQVDPVGK